MNQLIINMLTTMNSHDASLKVLDGVLATTIKSVKKNKKKIFILTVLGAVGFYQHEKDIAKLKKQISELERLCEPNEVCCENGEENE